jgi:hypothetical protein
MGLFTAIRLYNYYYGKSHSPADIEALAAAEKAERNRRDQVKAAAAVKPVVVTPVAVKPVVVDSDRKTVDEEAVRIANENMLREATEMAERKAAEEERIKAEEAAEE